jgi:polygalacturonase
MYFKTLQISLASFALIPAFTLLAQDTRPVSEPHIPSSCMTLSAAISAPRGVIAASDERKLDTARIQQALDHCEAGHAVVLRSNGVRNIFLAGPLTLRSNVTLVVDKDTALVASRDSRVYDLSPYSRGKPLERGHKCKPLSPATAR